MTHRALSHAWHKEAVRTFYSSKEETLSSV